MSTRALRSILLGVLVVGALSVHAQERGLPPAGDARRPEPATLVLWNRPIVTFRAAVGGVEPGERVRNARVRIDALRHSELALPVRTQRVQIGPVKGLIIDVGGRPVFGVVPADVDPESLVTVDQFATSAARQLRGALVARQEQRRPAVLARGIGLSLLATLLLAGAIRLIVIGRRRAALFVDALLRGRLLHVAGLDIRPTLETVKRATFRVLTWAAIVASVYLWLTFVLGQFPYTSPLGQRLGRYLIDRAQGIGAAFVQSLPNIILVTGVLLVTRAVALLIARFLAEVEHGARTLKWLAQEQARATRRIAVTIVWILGAATAYPLLPWAKSVVFQGISVVVGLVVSLASTGIVNQWISGLVILYSRSIRVGDFIRVGDLEGIVTDMGALATKVRTVRGEEVTIPNAVMVAEKVMNLTRLAADQGGLLSTSVTIGYDVPRQQVEHFLLKAAEATGGIRRSPSPRVLYWELGNFGVQYQLHVALERPLERATVRSDLNSRILDAFNANGVQIMTPHFESQPRKPVVAPPPSSVRLPGDADESPIELTP